MSNLVVRERSAIHANGITRSVAATTNIQVCIPGSSERNAHASCSCVHMRRILCSMCQDLMPMATWTLQTCRRVLTRGRELARRREPVGLPTECHEMKQQAEHPPGGGPGRQQRACEQGKDDELVHDRNIGGNVHGEQPEQGIRN